MALTPDTLHALQRHLEALKARSVELKKEFIHCDQEITALRILIPSEAEKPPIDRPRETFAAQVRRALAEIDRYVSPTDVALHMKQRGYKLDGKTNLTSMVNSELYRMAKSDNSTVVKRGRGKYKIIK